MGAEEDTGKQVEEEAMEDLELKDEDAEKIGGGDKASPALAAACATGKHIPEVTIHLF